ATSTPSLTSTMSVREGLAYRSGTGYDRRPARLRAEVLGRYFSWRAAPSTRSRVSSRPLGSRLNTRETVFMDTPAAAATSSILARTASPLARDWSGWQDILAERAACGPCTMA